MTLTRRAELGRLILLSLCPGQQETLKVTVRSWQLYGQLAVFLNPSRTDLEPNATYFVSYREAPVNINVTFTRDSCHDDRL